MNKKIIITSVVIIFLATILGLGINLIKNKIVTIPPQVKDNAVSTSTEIDHIEWIAPVKIENLNIFKDGFDASRAEFYKVGIFKNGTYKGGDILLANISPEEMSGNSRYRFVKQPDKITLLDKHSDELYDGDFFDQSKFSIDKTTTLSDLIFPEKINYKGSSFNMEGNNLNEDMFNKISLSSSDYKLAFNHPEFGNVYTDVNGLALNDDKIRQNGYYLEAPDGTMRTYSLNMDFYDSRLRIPRVVWSDGSINNIEYVNTDIGGCGSKNYASVISGISIKDLKTIGKTENGDNVYDLVDKNSLILKNIYNIDYNPYRTTKISFEQFVESRPVFFWFDPFDRLIKFQKAEFIPQTECGKPVIYLYPKDKMNVSVKIEPKGGFTLTEPNYGSGWNVTAYPDGKLIDLNSGISYPYLFWEGYGGIYTTPKKGFVVALGDIHDFLIEKLTKLGLNEKEQADFIEFWEPLMKDSPYYFVTFIGNKGMDEIAPLSISPKPDSIIRVLMDFMPLQKPIPVEGYSIKTPQRNGFTVVEWGGVLRK
jgi:hypothetical protein